MYINISMYHSVFPRDSYYNIIEYRGEYFITIKMAVYSSQIMKPRFIKSSKMAAHLLTLGYVVKPHEKNIYECCAMCANALYSVKGFIVFAAKKELKALGVMNSAK